MSCWRSERREPNLAARLARVGLLAGCVAALAWAPACSDDSSSGGTTHVTHNHHAKHSGKKGDASADQGVHAKPFTYSPVGKRDPFRSYLADLDAEKTKNSGRKLQATEQYALDQYRLTGLITGTSQPRAMVVDPKGMGHVLHIGSRIGKNGGRVTRITSSGIVIVQEYRAATGERMRVRITKKLPQSDLQAEMQ